MSACVILGGGGYIGFRWAKRLAKTGRFQRIVLADIMPPVPTLPPSAEFITCDIRQNLAGQIKDVKPDWIFNFAAVHREPGHAAHEYFDTNLAGARNTTAFAEATGCQNILFTSSIAVYGPTPGATTEKSPLYPVSPYGITKHAAELIHEIWWRAATGRRLLVCRPGVIYGPGDPGNILRMIRAVKRGYFLFPGRRDLRKSYGYIEGLLDSFEFAMDRPEAQLTFNYVERETEPLGRMVELIQEHFGKRIPTMPVPLPLLVLAARLIQVATRSRSSIHPVRVRKAATSTHIVPEVLKDLGFPFRYDFKRSLEDWAAAAPDDFR
jgi:nucleoside-diphosphate-sugar epimerase